MKIDSSEDGDEMIYWHTGSYGRDFTDHYFLQDIPFEEYSIEMKKHYQSAYDKFKSGSHIFEAWYPQFFQMDLDSMVRDFNDNIHECDGIISKNQYLKLQRDSAYEPDVVSPKDYNKLPERIQEKYMYYAWDSPWSEFGKVYDIIPIVMKMLEYYNLQIDDVRLICYYS